MRYLEAHLVAKEVDQVLPVGDHRHAPDLDVALHGGTHAGLDRLVERGRVPDEGMYVSVCVLLVKYLSATTFHAQGNMCLLRLSHGAVRDVDGGAVVAEAGVAVGDKVLHGRGRGGQVWEVGVRALDACVVVHGGGCWERGGVH